MRWEGVGCIGGGREESQVQNEAGGFGLGEQEAIIAAEGGQSHTSSSYELAAQSVSPHEIFLVRAGFASNQYVSPNLVFPNRKRGLSISYAVKTKTSAPAEPFI